MGGGKLQGSRGVFWFISVFFITQQIMNVIFNIYKKQLFLLLLILLLPISYIIQYSKISLPLNIQSLPIALWYYILGYKLKNILLKKSNFYLCTISIITLVLIFPFQKEVCLDIKYNNYGIPVISVLISLFMIYSIITLTKSIPSSKILSQLGKNSMTIMYLHQSINLRLSSHIHSLIILILCLFIPSILHYLMNNYKITRILFIGK